MFRSIGKWHGADPERQTEMGPVLLPTPLSPAVVFPKEALIARRVSRWPRPKAVGHPDMSPGARAGAGLVPCQVAPSEDVAS